MNKKIIIPTVALVAIMGAVIIGTYPVSAQDKTYNNLVTKIAQRFNLNESDVEEVVKELHSEKLASIKALQQSKLTQAVTDGKITEAQKQAIIAKYDEVQIKLDDLKDLSISERKVKVKEVFEDLEKWALGQGIDLKKLGGLGMRGRFMRDHKFDHSDRN